MRKLPWILTVSFLLGAALGQLVCRLIARGGEKRKTNYIAHPRLYGSTITSSAAPPLRGGAPT